MSVKQKFVAAGVLLVGAVSLGIWYLSSADIPVLEPSGQVGQKEKDLIIIAGVLSLIVVIPVYAMLIGFSIRYREGNKKAKYDPGLDGSRLFESIWWGVPLVIISILAVITYKSSHQLDPFKPLDSRPAITIQVISLQWKWLFIYPQQNISSLNYVQFPAGTPIKFEITSDAPMNSFWIPALGGQIYAMTGMSTHLNLEASKIGRYNGSSANISGEGFSGMNFIANATSQSEFSRWVNTVKNSPQKLDQNTYSRLAAPSKNDPVSFFSSADASLYKNVISKYEAPLYLTPARKTQ